MRNTGILIYGQGNLLDIANAKAAEILNTAVDLLTTNQDYMFVSYDEGKSSIGVDTAGSIVAKASLKASYGEYQVCVVDHMDSMTKEAQNKLLKTLEESAMVVIGVCYEDNIIPTVKSRMKKIVISENKELPDDVRMIFDGVIASMCGEHPEEILSMLRLVKEKDPESFFAVHREYVGELISTIGSCISFTETKNCSSLLLEKTMPRLASHRERCMSSGYSKDDFFMLIVTVIEDLKVCKGEKNVTV